MRAQGLTSASDRYSERVRISNGMSNRIIQVILASFALLLTAMLAQQAIGPAWTVAPYNGHLRVSSPSTAITPARADVPAEGTYRIRESHTTVTLADGFVINAIVREPLGAPSGRPACLFIHGAGTGKSSEVYGDIATSMASAGITTLVPDKRLDNYSTLHRDYRGSANDYEHSLDRLKRWPGVDGGKVGIYAESEGTWISTIIVSDRSDVAFAILTSPPVFTARRQMAMAMAAYCAETGVPRQLAATIPRLTTMDFSAIGLEYANFNDMQYLRKLHMPLLVNYGSVDVSMPIEQGAEELIRQAGATGNRNVTVRYYRANHQMRAGSRVSAPNLPLVTRYTRNTGLWVNAATGGTGADGWATPMLAGDQPRQLFAVPTDTSAGLMSSFGLLAGLTLGGLAVCLLAAVLGTAFAAYAAIRRHRVKPVGGRFGQGMCAPLWASGILASLTVIGLLGYLWQVVPRVLRLESDAALYQGGWIALRFCAVAAVVALAWLVVQMIAQRHALAIGIGHRLAIILTVCGSLGLIAVMVFWNLFLS